MNQRLGLSDGVGRGSIVMPYAINTLNDLLLTSSQAYITFIMQLYQSANIRLCQSTSDYVIT